MIVFENDGTLDMRAVKIMGVNSKDNKDSAIGYFGTGLKYAIAILLRAGATISILTGGTMYQFNVQRTKIRNDEFNVITMNDEELGFTTDLGKNWEVWMAFREIYSNMLDEGGEDKAMTFLPDPDPSKTYVIVDRCEEFEKCYNNKHEFFLDRSRHETIHVGEEVNVMKRENRRLIGHIFFKGVRVMETRINALFDYCYHTGLTLTEDRTVKDGWDTHYHLSREIVQMTDKSLIKQFIMAPENIYESILNYRFHSQLATEEFLDTVAECRRKYKDTGVNSTAIEVLKQRRVSNTPLPKHSCPLNSVEEEQLERASRFCKEVLELELDKYKLIIADDLGKNQLGRADIDNGIMYVSKQCFKEGTKRVAVCILEEYTHCHEEVEDETLQQKWVYLNHILSIGERLQGEPL